MPPEVTPEMKALEARVAKAEEAATKAEEANARLIAAGNNGHHRSGSSSSDEMKAMRYFGAKSVKDLLTVNTGHEKFRAVPDELKFLVRQLKEDLDVSRLTQQIFHGEARDINDTPGHVKGVLDGNNFAREVLAPRFKAFGSTTPGSGDEWVPTIVSNQYIEEFELDRQVVSQFRPINMPSSPYDVPVQTDVTIARRQVESCDPADNIAPNNFGTGKITLEAQKLVEHMCLPEELNEDSAPQILALVRGEVSEAQGRAWETAVINGAFGGGMDNDVAGLVDARTSWDGLRKLALDNAATEDFGAGAVTTSGLRNMRTLMGKFGVSERNLVWKVSSKVYQQMINLPEVTTVDKFGPMATILRGSLAALDGIPIVISEFMRDDVDATGINSVGGPNDKSCLLLTNRTRYMWGTRRPMRVRATIDPTPPGDRWILASWWRGDFKGHAQGANETSTVLGINIS